MYNSFGSGLWLTPFSKHCRTDNVYWKHFFEGRKGHNHTHHCDDMEFRSNYSGWPTDVINIEIPSLRGAFMQWFVKSYIQLHNMTCLMVQLLAGTDAYPSVSELAQDATSDMECGIPIQMSFSAREVSDGTFFKAIEDYDPDTKRLLYQLEK